MERMTEHTGISAPISSLSLLLVQTQAARWKAASPEQLTGAHLYLDIAKSGYLFHAVGNVMEPPLIQVKLAWHLFGASPLPSPVLAPVYQYHNEE